MKERVSVATASMPTMLQRMAVLTLTLFVGAVLAACGDTSAQPEPGTGAPMTDNMGTNGDAITLSDIADNPEQYIGQTVTLRAPLGEVLGTRAFTLSDPAALGFDSLLVVGVTEGTIPMEEEVFGTDAAEPVDDAEIEVTGVVRELDVAALEQELNYQIPDPILGAYSEETAIVADSVRVLPETE